MFEFTETLTIEVPDVEEQVSAFTEKEYKASHGLIIELAAIHEGMTANFNFYPAAALEAALQTWVSPYPKPIIMNHDPYSEPVGRVMAAKMEKEADGTPYTKLQVAITDPEAISKVLDQRYLTGSVGGKAEEANCSVCGADWAQASMANLPCRHSRGKTYKGKLAYMEMNGISFKEYSFVNMPADQRSNIRSIATDAAQEGEENEGWVRSARVFSLDMNNEEILEFSESVENRNVLEGMKKKEATPVYMNLKGAFLSAMAVAESERVEESAANDKESDVDPNNVQEEEDVLAVAEGLATDLAAPAEEPAAEEAEVEGDEDKSDDDTQDDAPEDSSAEEAVVEDADEGDEENSEGDKPEGQEAPKDKDVDPEDSKGAPVSREDADDEDEKDSEEAGDAGTDEDGEEANEASADETDLDEATQALESRVEELEAREQSLLDENAKLRGALKRNLAERVVDMKIALGMNESEKREALLEEHAKRSASSLADSLRDLAAMPPKVTEGYAAIPQVTEESAAVSEDDTVTEGDLDDNEEEGNEPTAEEKAEEGLYKLLNAAVLN